MVHHQRGAKWTPQLSPYDEESTGSNSTPIRTNSGRPPLPIRRMGKNRLPPTSSRDGVMHALSPSDVSECTQYSASTMTSTGGSLASVLQHPREAVRDGGEQWRKHGKLFRAKLLMQDEESGGNTFVLSNNCQIERYYDVAEKVSHSITIVFVLDDTSSPTMESAFAQPHPLRYWISSSQHRLMKRQN
jgi:hypothetical protein